MSDIQIHPIAAFTDNYLWLIHDGKNAVVVDPGDAAPVQAYLDKHQLSLCAILLTHHHSDHIDGVRSLLNHLTRMTALPVYGPLQDQQNGRIPTITHGCQQSTRLLLPEFNLYFDVLEVPGHTRSHIAYYCAELDSLFCGDTLFAGGCGRLFEGTPAQMVNSLHKITALPELTKIYCAHEYTLANLRFALTVEPDNVTLQTRFQQVASARQKGLATVPSQLDVELQTNPFLRCNEPGIIRNLQKNNKLSDVTDEVTVFAAIREWKNGT